MVQAQNSFLIRKQTFIVKNERPIDDVYIREKKVSDCLTFNPSSQDLLNASN